LTAPASATDAQTVVQKISAEIDALRDDLLCDTARLLQFRTVSGGSPEQEEEYQREIPACLAWLKELSASMGFEFREIQGVAAEIVWNHPDENAPRFAIASHIDVVTPVGEWTHPPFSGAIADGYMWGRGTQDDKGPLMQSLYGMYAVKRAGIQPPCSVAIVIGTMEETGQWRDMQVYLQNAKKPDFAFTPDANFPIINGEKGMLSVYVDAEWPDGGIDGETGMEFIRLTGGERENIVPASAELVIRFPSENRTEVLKELVRTTTEYVVEHDNANITLQPNRQRDLGDGRYEAVASFVGKAAHSSTPAKGHNAIVDAIDFVKGIETFPEPMRRFASFLHIAGADMTGESIGVAANHDFIGPTTVCLSLLDLGKTRGRAVLNIRPTMGWTADKVLEQLRKTLDAYQEPVGRRMELSVKGEKKNPIYLDPQDPRVAGGIKALQEAYSLVTGREPELKSIGGTTYAKALPNCCAFGPVMSPEEAELAHQCDERVPVEAIIRNAKIYGASVALFR
jgi:succinyl-diaminopimelate desuccinylase